MSLEMECHLKWNVTQNGISLIIECIKNGITLTNKMSLKTKFYSKWVVAFKIEFHSKWNVTQVLCHSKYNVSQMECNSK